MSERIQQLLREVRRSAEDETAPRQLRTRFPSAGERKLADLRREIAQEIAFSLGKAGRKLEAALRSLELILLRKDRESLTPTELEQLRAAFEAERRRAEEHLLHLQIQREALGFRRSDELLKKYRIPRWPDDSSPE